MNQLPTPYQYRTPDVFDADCFLPDPAPQQTRIAPYVAPKAPRPVYQESPQARHDRVMFNRACVLIGTLGVCVTGLVYAAGATAGTPGVMLLGLSVAVYWAKSGAKQDKRTRVIQNAPQQTQIVNNFYFYQSKE